MAAQRIEIPAKDDRQLIATNQLQLLLFGLGDKQLFGINVFKVREVIHCPRLTITPSRHHAQRGIAHVREQSMPFIDLGCAIGLPATSSPPPLAVVCEYSRQCQAFLVSSIERIVTVDWKSITSPPKASGLNSYLTAVARFEDHLVEIIDVEKVAAEAADKVPEVSDHVAHIAANVPADKIVMVVDDSAVARGQITRTLKRIGCAFITASDGAEAYEKLQQMLAEEADISSKLAMVISDIEMPNMDGYTLTSRIRSTPGLEKLHILLHTSLSGGFSRSLAARVGANDFIPKFSPDELAQAVLKQIADKATVDAAS